VLTGFFIVLLCFACCRHKFLFLKLKLDGKKANKAATLPEWKLNGQHIDSTWD
jgi:hypothetical protein